MFLHYALKCISGFSACFIRDCLDDLYVMYLRQAETIVITWLIFNWWGEIVFESHDVNIGWDGTYGNNGKQAQDGAYTYKIIYKVLKTDERRLLIEHNNLIR